MLGKCVLPDAPRLGILSQAHRDGIPCNRRSDRTQCLWQICVKDTQIRFPDSEAAQIRSPDLCRRHPDKIWSMCPGWFSLRPDVDPTNCTKPKCLLLTMTMPLGGVECWECPLVSSDLLIPPTFFTRRIFSTISKNAWFESLQKNLIPPKFSTEKPDDLAAANL